MPELLDTIEEKIVDHLLLLKSDGDDCTENESAWIKAYYDTHRDGGKLASVYTPEWDEWNQEVEEGYRD